MKRKFIRTSAIILTLVLLIPMCVFVLSVPTSASAQKPLEGKTISILGDSISTYGDFSGGAAASTTNSTISGNVPYYKDSTPFTLTSVNDTWWRQAADALGATVLVNNSWSGSSFSTSTNGNVPAYLERCVQLHDDTGSNAGEEPDIIAVYMGTNDFNALKDSSDTFRTDALDYNSLLVGTTYKTPSNIAEGYAIVLDKITKRYENAEIYCFTILEKKNLNSTQSDRLKVFNQTLAEVATHYGAYVVDLYNDSGITSKTDASATSLDTYLANELHPNVNGMDAITNCFLSAVYENSEYMPTGTSVYNVTYETDKGLFKQGEPKAVLGGSFTLDIFDAAKTKCSNLKITMGGKDITSSCKTEGKISIANVTGDIVISESVVEEHECNFVESRIINLTCTQRGTHVLKCTICGKEKFGDYVQPEGHKYDGDTDVDCNVCGKERKLEETTTDTEEVSTQANVSEEESSGCGSALSGGIALVAFTALGASCITVKRKKK